jgi:hypothetical protein
MNDPSEQRAIVPVDSEGRGTLDCYHRHSVIEQTLNMPQRNDIVPFG